MIAIAIFIDVDRSVKTCVAANSECEALRNFEILRVIEQESAALAAKVSKTTVASHERISTHLNSHVG